MAEGDSLPGLVIQTHLSRRFYPAVDFLGLRPALAILRGRFVPSGFGM